MKLWHRYIAWVDADLGDGWPNMSGLSSLMAFVPLSLAIVFALTIHPNEKPGLLEALLIIPPTVLLLSVWLWRAYLCAMRQARAIKRDRHRD